MNSTRISDSTLSSILLDELNKTQTEYSKEQLKISSGKKYLCRSENPSETDKAAIISNEMTKNSRWTSNVDDATSWETATDSALQKIIDSMQSAKSLTVEMNSGTLDSSDYESLATEFNEILETLVNLGNSKYLGTEIFAGVTTGSDPFTTEKNENGEISKVTFLNGSTTSQRSVSISDSSQVSYGTLGNDVFDFKHLENTGTEESPAWEYVDANIFDTIISIRDSLENGELPDEKYSDRLSSGLDNVILAGVKNGAGQNKLSSISSMLTSQNTVMTNQLGNVTNLDSAEAATYLSQLEVSLTASYKVIAAMNSMSIMDYI